MDDHDVRAALNRLPEEQRAAVIHAVRRLVHELNADFPTALEIVAAVGAKLAEGDEE